MKRLGVYVCIAILFVGFLGVSSPTALAQFETPDAVLGSGVEADSAAVISASTPPNPQPNFGNGAVEGCSLWGEDVISKCINAAVTWLIKSTLLQIAGFLVWITANMLNYAIQISVLDFAKWAPDSLYPIWIVVRQIVSLAVVFAGLYLGFMYIIGREQTFTRYIGWLVIFALFVNFSYPITRALVDVSNIISLNIYTAAVGSGPLTTDFSQAVTRLGDDTAGAQIMNKLGLFDLIGSATQVESQQRGTGLTNRINTVPGALIAVVFVFYAAYIFFMATMIIAVRTAVLVFLIVASPLLLLDSVVPKLGDVAMKMRQFFFQQLAVAPVFMIMLALTLKFMDVFQATNPTTGQPGPLAGTSGAIGALGSGDGVQIFFSILMMLIMLHITLRVTRDVSGAAGKYATDAMGKVGGFGLGLASGGAGLLARGTIGAGAARWRESDWMKNKQDTRLGRGLYTLSNSLAQSTFDTRNIGMVSAGMQKAGLTSIAGVGMQKGLAQNYDERFKAREQETRSRAAYIKDAGVRGRFLEQKTNTLGAVAQKGFLGAVGLRGANMRNDAEIIRDKIEKDKAKIKERYNSFKDEDRKRQFLESQPDDIKEYLKNNSSSAEAVGTSQTSASAESQTKKPNLDTTELDNAGFYPPNRGGPGDGGSGAAATAPQKPSPTAGPAAATIPQEHEDTIETVENGFGFKGTVYPTYAEAVSARRVYKQTRATGAANTNNSSQTPPPEPPTPPSPAPKGGGPSPSSAPANNNETATA